MVMLVMTGAARAQDPNAGMPAAVPPSTGGGGEASGAALFGRLGQIVLTGDLQLSFSHDSASMGDASSNTFVFSPAADYFAAPNVSIGGAVVLAHSSFDSGIPGSSGSDTTSIGILLRGGYNLRLADMISIWPRLAIGYAHTSSGSGGTDVSGYSVPLLIDAPILVHLAPHFFVGVGPAFQTELISKVEGNDASKTTSIGISTVVGGYFGGT
jgi:hypothetical protein